MRRFAAGLAVFLVLMSLVPAEGSIILGFDDIPVGPIADGYGNLGWDYMSVGVGGAAAFSPTHVAYNNHTSEVAMVDGSAFDFLGAYLTAVHNADFEVEVTGLKSGGGTWSETVTVYTSGPTWYDFKFWDIVELTFDGDVDGDEFQQMFAMDDFEYNTAPDPFKGIPEPSTLVIWSLLGLLGITVGWYRRRKAA